MLPIDSFRRHILLVIVMIVPLPHNLYSLFLILLFIIQISICVYLVHFYTGIQLISEVSDSHSYIDNLCQVILCSHNLGYHITVCYRIILQNVFTENMITKQRSNCSPASIRINRCGSCPRFGQNKFGNFKTAKIGTLREIGCNHSVQSVRLRVTIFIAFFEK